MKNFKELLHNPRLYYVMVPAVVALWPLYAGLVATHRCHAAWERQKIAYEDGGKTIISMLELDPERIDAKMQHTNADFSFPVTVNNIARQCNIAPADYKLQTSSMMKGQGGQESQDADITLKQVDLANFARFLSSMQLQGANLQCTSLKLTKQKNAADIWKIDIKFKYYKG